MSWVLVRALAYFGLICLPPAAFTWLFRDAFGERAARIARMVGWRRAAARMDARWARRVSLIASLAWLGLSVALELSSGVLALIILLSTSS